MVSIRFGAHFNPGGLMKSTSLVCALVSIGLFASAVFASTAKTSKAEIKVLVEQYHQQVAKDSANTYMYDNSELARQLEQGSSVQGRVYEPHCAPKVDKCIEAACGRMSPYACDEASEVTDVAAACRGNSDGECLKVVCGKMSAYLCDELSEIKSVLTMCRGNYDGGCITAICAKLSPYACDEIPELQAIARSCAQ